MKSIPIQQDNVTQLSADDFNEIPRELENAIQSADITLSSGDLSQLAKHTADYSGSGDFWEDSGTSSANEVNLQVVGSHKQPPALRVGMRFRFKAEYTNTFTAVTFAPGSLSSGLMSKVQVANGGTPSILVGDIVEGNLYEAIYDETPDGLTGYYRLQYITNEKIESMSVSKLTDGSKSFGDTTIIQIGAGGTDGALRWNSDEYGAVSEEGSGDGYQLGCYHGGNGFRFPVGTGYGGGPGDNAIEFRPASFNIDTADLLVRSESISTSFNVISLFANADIKLTGIGVGTKFHGATLEIVEVGASVTGVTLSSNVALARNYTGGDYVKFISAEFISSDTFTVGDIALARLHVYYDPSFVT